MSIDPTAPDGALCTLHPDRPALQVCTRCGNFMCELCAAGGGLCPSCRALGGGEVAFPFRRDAHDFNSLLAYAYTQWKVDAVLLSVAAMIVAGIGGLGSFGSNIAVQLGSVLVKTNLPLAIAVMGGGAVIGLGVSLLLQGIAQMGMIRMCFDVLQGRRAELPRLFSQLKRLGAFVMQWLIIFGVAMGVVLSLGLVIGAAALALGLSKGVSFDENPALAVAMVVGALTLVPVFIGASIWASPVIFAPMELVYAGGGGWESLKRAFVIGEGHRLEIFGYLAFGTLLTMAALIVGFLALCIGLLVTIPIAQSLHHMLLASKFLALRTGCDGLPPRAEE